MNECFRSTAVWIIESNDGADLTYYSQKLTQEMCIAKN